MTVSPALKELLLQSLEHERGGVILYQTALECAREEGLREEWEKYLLQTATHVETLTTACRAIGIDPDQVTPGRHIVRHTGTALAVAMKMALAAEDVEAAERVACECIMLAETKDHFDWELNGRCARDSQHHGRGRPGWRGERAVGAQSLHNDAYAAAVVPEGGAPRAASTSPLDPVAACG